MSLKLFSFIQGVWVHPEIDNPDYSPDPELYYKPEICAIGFDLWQVKSGTIFDNVLITDDIALAKKYAEDIWKPTFVSTPLIKGVKFHTYGF